MAILVDHTKDIGGGSDDINIYSLVLARLQFLEDDANTTEINSKKISLTTYEIMLWLNDCFRLESSLVGIESNYTKKQLSLMADVVSYYILLYRAISLGAGIDGYTIISSSGTSVSASGFFLKTAESDDTTVTWEQVKTTDNSNHGGINISKLMDELFFSMCDKMKIYNCMLCRCNDCTLELRSVNDGIVQPFIILGC